MCKPEEKCNNYPLCTGGRKRPRVVGALQQRLEHCSICLANPVCQEDGCSTPPQIDIRFKKSYLFRCFRTVLFLGGGGAWDSEAFEFGFYGNHVPSGGNGPGKRLAWSPHGRCVEHMRANTPTCTWTFCSNSLAG